MNLYEIDTTLRDVLENGIIIDNQDVMTEDGELFSADQIEALNIERDKKIEGLSLYIKELGADSEALEKEIKTLQARKKSKDNKAEYLKNYLLSILHGEKFETSKVAVSYRKSTKVIIADENSIPAEFWKEKTTRDVDKAGLKKALQGGADIGGAFLETSNNIQIK